MVDQIDKVRVLENRVGNVEKGGRGGALGDAFEPVVFGRSGAAVEGRL